MIYIDADFTSVDGCGLWLWTKVYLIKRAAGKKAKGVRKGLLSMKGSYPDKRQNVFYHKLFHAYNS